MPTTTTEPRSPTKSSNQFRPVNSLASRNKPTFYATGNGLGQLLDHDAAMVRERDPARTSSGQYLSPQKLDRQPLANISAKIQSPSQKMAASEADDEVDFSSLKPTQQVEFGKASPLRNPLKKHSPSSLFVPKRQVYKPQGNAQFVSSAAQQAQSGGNGVSGAEARGFYLPGQRPQTHGQQPSSSAALEHALQRSFQPQQQPSFRIPQPTNPPPITSLPPSKPQFSSLGPNTYFQPFQPPKRVVDLTKDEDDEDTFDPDAAIRAESGKFGEVDPYAYIDAGQANENLKNLLEGAFEDDGDVVRRRLKKRTKKAIQDGNDAEAKSLAGKLASLKVKDEEDEKGKDAEEEVEEEEEDDGTVDGMAVKLLPHQVDGVSWMIDKEIGGPKKNGVFPKGGILADDMGLGKTIQSVALILTNPHPGPDAKPEHKKQKLPGKDVSKSTLVVAPLALIKQWEAEIKTKVTRSHALRVLVHHGPSRTKSARELQKYDVVITTYQTLTSEHAGSQMAISNGIRIGCMGVNWYRIMLDEAHSIKNRNAKSTQACYAMNAWYRWCLSGTPMQNNLDELQSLIKFLRIKPYCELPKWKADITQPMKNGKGGLAIKRLQYFLSTFMKRRTKDTLKKSGALNFGGSGKEGAEGGEKKAGGMQIVKREVVTVECDFDAAEKEFYDRLQDRADKRLKEMMKEKGGNDYIGALVLLLRLRQACNHSALIEMALSKDKETVNAQMASQKVEDKHGRRREDDMDDLTRLMGGVSVEAKKCDVCQVDLSADEAREGSARCKECDADILMMKKSKKRTKKVKKVKEVKAEPKRRQHMLPNDSDDEEEGEWIAKGPERRIDLGKAGGTDDEDAEGGGETLDSIDSEQSADDASDGEDSPPRAHRRRRAIKQEDVDDEEDSEADSDDSDSQPDDDAPHATSYRRGFDMSAERKPSTKIRHLLRILHNEAGEHKIIVFSQFTTMLDLMQPHLKSAGLRYVRYDGSMRNDAREASLNALRTDPKCRVLLCSLKCGSLGLNLTAASRVVIVEPFWNPFVEEQAIDRVHRLNQTVDVKVYRLTVRNSVEEKILALQERKRELANAAIDGAVGNVNKLSMKEILGLFQHDAVHSSEDHDEANREMDRKFGGDARLFEGKDAGITLGRDGLGMLAKKEVRSERPKEHEIYGRRCIRGSRERIEMLDNKVERLQNQLQDAVQLRQIEVERLERDLEDARMARHPAATPDNEPSRLLALPPELREQIWQYVLCGNLVHFADCYYGGENNSRWLKWEVNTYPAETAGLLPKCEGFHGGGGDRLTFGLLQSCREIYNDASLLPYSGNTFCFEGTLGRELFPWFLRQLQPKRVGALASLVIKNHGFGGGVVVDQGEVGDLTSQLTGLRTLVLCTEVHSYQSLNTFADNDDTYARIHTLVGLANFQNLALRTVKVRAWADKTLKHQSAHASRLGLAETERVIKEWEVKAERFALGRVGQGTTQTALSDTPRD
ncbi:hypothetical protein LTR15_004723 [Elasticomyces elasticus]|nr:hypothetical protein LTR15_004723 [Elasticomyces elasticus]